ncbi:hypothetical protein Ahy_A02g004980 [Arachis hypogaea]|uniref:Serine-threonine/tyrosine-protein kinase catalytic domain-containing protein n=1 Tax=Arachis hypogaea TaxID=3818 RepID=A0A445E5E5_ARAHY|nr:hypothetical protein Ahy_A02g004980 [Arachis hypogaea]
MISYYELSQATNGFDESNLLGRGSFGCVQRLTFKWDGGCCQKLQCRMLAMRNLRHRNLMKIIEFGSKGIISTKGDVYSFGIMLMETFTRKKPTDDLFVAGLSMKGWISESLSRAIDRVVDSNLLQDEGHHHVDDIIASTSSILKLALNCCEDLPEE